MLDEILKNKEILDTIAEIYSEIDNEKELVKKWKSFIDFLYHAGFIKEKEKKFYYSYEYEEIMETLEKANEKIKIENNTAEENTLQNDLFLFVKNKINKQNKNHIVKKYNKNIIEIQEFLENKKFSSLEDIKKENIERKNINTFLQKAALIKNPETLSKEEIVSEFSKLKNINNIQLYDNIKELQDNSVIKFFPPNERKFGILFLLKYFPKWTKDNFTYSELEKLFYDKELQKYIKILDINLKELKHKKFKKEALDNFLNKRFTQEQFIYFIENYLKENLPEISFPSFSEVYHHFKQSGIVNTKLEEN